MFQETFGDRLASAMGQFGPICVGIDPHAFLLEQWGLPDTAEGVRTFALTVVEALGGHVAAFKPQVAFFERFGSAGYQVLEQVIAACRDAKTLCIADVKRGDIGSTMAGYAHAWLNDASPLAVDAMTVSPYLGAGSLRPAFDQAAQTGRGLFVLGLTSNPEGASVQHAVSANGTSVAAGVVSQCAQWNSECDFNHMSVLGVVVGATVGSAVQDCGVDLHALHGPILAPGFGAQGAGSEQVRAVFGDNLSDVLVSSSRGILKAGPTVNGLRDAFESTHNQVMSILAK